MTDYLGLTKGTVSQTITVLEKNSLLIKKPDKNDKRLLHLKLSSSGKKIIKNIFPPDVFATALNDISTNEKQQFEKTLKRLLLIMQLKDRIHSFGVCNSCCHFITEKTQNYCGLTKLPLDKIQITKICREHSKV